MLKSELYTSKKHKRADAIGCIEIKSCAAHFPIWRLNLVLYIQIVWKQQVLQRPQRPQKDLLNWCAWCSYVRKSKCANENVTLIPVLLNERLLDFPPGENMQVWIRERPSWHIMTAVSRINSRIMLSILMAISPPTSWNNIPGVLINNTSSLTQCAPNLLLIFKLFYMNNVCGDNQYTAVDCVFSAATSLHSVKWWDDKSDETESRTQIEKKVVYFPLLYLRTDKFWWHNNHKQSL